MAESSFECPITLSIMEDPVIAGDGYTYERSAIVLWLREHGTSPQTRQRMSGDSLLPNRAIAELIEAHLLKNTDERSDGSDADATATATASADTDDYDHDTSKAKKSSIMEVTRTFLPNELKAVTESTSATLHIVHSDNTSNTEPSSARVHIQTPNPSVDDVETSLTTPNHICCVIDVSGSMGYAATSKDEDGNPAEDMGLNILDVVKFSTSVIAQSLNPQDMLSIIAYGDKAHVALQPTHMNLKGKKEVKKVLRGIALQTRTNLFAGVKLGILTANQVGDMYVNSIFVLTDGVPTEHPPLGYERSMSKVLSKNPIFGSLSTFGFGYQLDSKLLMNIAKLGGGYYSFIPDSGMVGTCFINAVANCRCIFGVQPVLKISGCDVSLFADSGIIIAGSNRNNGNKGTLKKWGGDESKNAAAKDVHGLTLDGCLEATLVDSDIYVRLTPLRYGADIDVMLKPSLFKGKQNADNAKIQIFFDTVGGNTAHLEVLPGDGNTEDEVFHIKRTQFVNTAFTMSNNPFVRGCCGTFTEYVTASTASDAGSKLDALYMDMKGEASNAIKGYVHFETWGKHFLLSLSTAHLHQLCNNFKDPGVQGYGTGTLFSSLQSSLDDIFETLPLPIPSRVPLISTFTKGSAPTNMQVVFNNRNCVCVHGKTIVTTKTSAHHEISYIPIRKIKKGDLVLAANGTYAKVDCVVKTVVDEALQDPFQLIQVGQLCVTPYHPVKLNDQSGWQFPVDISQQFTTANSVYNLVLESGQRHNAIMMDGIETITLGHGLTDDATLQHTYFGTDAIVTDLRKMRGGSEWKDGHIVLRQSDVTRDTQCGHICHISEVKADEGVAVVNTCDSCVPCAA